MWIVFTYIWLPFMILPVYAALERVPQSYLEASRDLGAHGLDDVAARSSSPSRCPVSRRLDLHLLADARRLHHAARSSVRPARQLIGTVVFENLGLANNAPFAAAFATVPLAIMAVYLVIVKRLGAFESL